MARGIKYTRKLRLSGPSKPIKSFEQIIKANEADDKSNSLFGGKDVLGLKSSKGYKWGKPKGQSKADKQAEQVKKLQEQEDNGFSLIRDSWDVLENVVGDAKDIAIGTWKLPMAIGGGIKDNGLEVWKNVTDPIETVARGIEQSYGDIPEVGNLSKAIADTAMNLGEGNFTEAGKAAVDTQYRIMNLLPGVGTAVNYGLGKAGLDPVKALGRTPEYKDYRLKEFAKKVEEDPLFYALDMFAGTGAVAKVGKAALGPARRVPVVRNVVRVGENRMKWREAAKGHVQERSTKSAAANYFYDAISPERGFTTEDAFLVQQAAHAISPKMEVALRAVRENDSLIRKDAVLEEMSPKVQSRYEKFTKNFVRPFQTLERMHEKGFLNKAEYQEAVSDLLRKVDDDIRLPSDAYQRMRDAVLQDAVNRKLVDRQTFLRKYKPLMMLTGDLEFDQVIKRFKELVPDKRPRGFVKPLRSDLGAIGIVYDDGLKKGTYTIKYMDTKGNPVFTVRNVLKKELKDRLIKYKVSQRAAAEDFYYDSVVRNINDVKGDDIVPMYVHHADRADYVPTATFNSEPRAATNANVSTDYSLWQDGQVSRNQLIAQYKSMLGGVNTAMRHHVMDAMVKSAKDPSFDGIHLIKKADELPRAHDKWKVLSTGDDQFNEVSAFIKEGNEAIKEYNRLVDPAERIAIPAEKDLKAIVIHENLYNYIKATVGFEKEAVHALEKATNIWKTAVLSLRPAFVVNNVVGNQVLAMLNDPQLLWEQTVNIIRKRDKKLAKDLTYNQRFLNTEFGNATTSFGRSEYVKWEKTPLPDKYGKLPETKAALERFKKFSQVGFLASAAHEDTLRHALVIRRLKNDPKIKELIAKDKVPETPDTSKISRAYSKLQETDPTYAKSMHDMVINDVNNIMGDYRYYSPLEKKIKFLVPFYGWYRHIMKYAMKELNKPLKGRMAAEVGRNQEEFPELLNFPAFAAHFIPFDHWLPIESKDGRERYLDFAGMNPFATVPDVMENLLILGNVFGQSPSGGAQNSQVLSMTNPLLTTFIESMTGTDVRTGAKKDAASGGLAGFGENILESLPPVRLLERGVGSLTGADDPLNGVDPNDPSTYLTRTGEEKQMPKAPAYEKSFSIALANFLGIPVRDINRESMERLAERIKSEQSKWKLPTPRKRKTKDTPWGPVANPDYVETKSPSLIQTYLQERG